MGLDMGVTRSERGQGLKFWPLFLVDDRKEQSWEFRQHLHLSLLY